VRVTQHGKCYLLQQLRRRTLNNAIRAFKLVGDGGWRVAFTVNLIELDVVMGNIDKTQRGFMTSGVIIPARLILYPLERSLYKVPLILENRSWLQDAALYAKVDLIRSVLVE